MLEGVSVLGELGAAAAEVPERGFEIGDLSLEQVDFVLASCAGAAAVLLADFYTFLIVCCSLFGVAQALVCCVDLCRKSQRLFLSNVHMGGNSPAEIQP